MSSLALELDDRALALARAGRVLATAPSAVFDRDSGISEPHAWSRLRSHPTITSTRHLGLVLTGRGAATSAPARVREELDRLLATHPPGADESIWIATPAQAQLRGLEDLLEIVRDTSVRLAGFVDAATAGVAALGLQRPAIVLEFGLHHAAATSVEAESGRACRRRALVAPHSGLIELYQAWLGLISATMVKRTRFDPLHDASIEQQLFDVLPELAREAVTMGGATAQVSKGGERFHVDLTHDQFVAAAEPVARQIAGLLHGLRPAGASLAIVVPRAIADLPGLRSSIDQFVGCELVRVPDGFASAAVSLLELPGGAPEQDNVRLLRRLPLEGAPGLATTTSREWLGTGHPGEPPPSHVLFEGRAYPLEGQPLTVGRSAGASEHPATTDARISITLPEGLAGVSRRHCTLVRDNGQVVLLDHSRFGTFVNGERVAERVHLLAGDRVRLGDPGVELELIALGDKTVTG